MKFILGFIAIAIASVTGSMMTHQSSIKRTIGEYGSEVVSNDEAEITVFRHKMITFKLNNPHKHFQVIGMFGEEKFKEVAKAIEGDFYTIVSEMKSFNPNMGHDSSAHKVFAVWENASMDGVEYVAESKKEFLDPGMGGDFVQKEAIEFDDPKERIYFSFNCVSHNSTINRYQFLKFGRSVRVDTSSWDVKPIRDRDLTQPGTTGHVVKFQRIKKFGAGSEEYEAGFLEAQEAAIKHCESVYKVVASAPSLRKAVLGPDN